MMTIPEAKAYRRKARQLVDIVEYQDAETPVEAHMALWLIRDREMRDYRETKDVAGLLFMLGYYSYHLGRIMGKREERARRKNGKKQ